MTQLTPNEIDIKMVKIMECHHCVETLFGTIDSVNPYSGKCLECGQKVSHVKQ